MHWAARAQNTAITGVRIDGIQELVQELRSLDPNTELDRYDHKDRRALLTIYRDALSKRPIGYLFVKTQVPHQDEVYDKLGILYPDESPAEPLPVRPVGSHSIVRNRKKGARND